MRMLGELEARVMRRIWDRDGPVTVRDITDDLRRDRPIAYTTVMTVMDNLRKKGWLRRTDHGRAYRAAALMRFVGELSAEEASALEEAYRRLAGGIGAGPGDAR